MQSSILSDSRTPFQEETLYPLAVTPIPPFTQTLASTPLLSVSVNLTVLGVSWRWNQTADGGACLLSPGGLSPRHVSTSALHYSSCSVIGCSVIPPILLIHSSLEEWLFWKHFGCFHFSALINNAGVSTHVQELHCSKWMYLQLEVWLFMFSYLFHFILLYLVPTFPYGCKMSKYKRKCSLKLWVNAYMR